MCKADKSIMINFNNFQEPEEEKPVSTDLRGAEADVI